MENRHQLNHRFYSYIFLPKKNNEVWATSGQGYLLSRIFEPITTARHLVTMKGIVCTIERVERRVNINIVDGAGVRLIKTIDMERGDH